MTSGRNWIRATDESPCAMCGGHDWCSKSGDGTVVACMRNAQGAYSTRTSTTGATTNLHWCGTGDPPARASLPAWRQPTARVPLASVKLRDQVYRRLLELLSLEIQHRTALTNRGLCESEIQRRGFRTLPIRGRSKIALQLHTQFGDVILGVPGLIVKVEAQRGYLTLAGSSGLLIPVRNHDQQIVAMKVRRDSAIKGPKYVYLSSKKYNGPGPGAPVHVPLGITADLDEVRVTEGELKADIATVLSGVPTLSIAGAGNWLPILEHLNALKCRRVRLAFDADVRRNPMVAQALSALACQLATMGIEIGLEHWDEATAKGIDDLLLGGHQPELLWGLPALDEIAVMVAATHRSGRKLNQVPPEPINRPEVEIGPDEWVVNQQAVAALANDINLYQRGGALVRTIQDELQADSLARARRIPRIEVAPLPFLRERLTAQVKFIEVKSTDVGEKRIQKHPPDWCVKAVASRGTWPGMRCLEAIVEFPVLRPNGTILTQSGYDSLTGLYLDSEIAITVPEHPTLADARSAAQVLVSLVADFPFAKPEHKSAWLASILTLVARFAFRGPAPLFLIDANIRGSGKTLLAELVALIVTGRSLGRMSNPESDEECRKRITTLVMRGEVLVLIDNIVGAFGCGSLDAALTATVWRDRILGRSEAVELPIFITWIGSGNNVQLAADTGRRVCHIRLQSPEENPENRSDFRFPNILQHTLENRAAYLSAALTILRAYYVAGQPAVMLRPWGSFEDWSRTVRAPLVWCGQEDPALTREEF
ncbi:MAG: hypothetical protein JWN70_612, partial [Planctomycetaceae bacterium]|nr:hypothetical protein [Planctomycetaceae bacterium]